MKVSGERVHPGMKRPRLSPLRYPGGKSGLYSTIRQIIRVNRLSGSTYIEPFAGGAGAALGLLITGEVGHVVINDLDPAVHAFWLAVTRDNQRFAEAIATCKVDVGEWARQRSIYLANDASDYFALGFATFYLNRTNRSGVLNGGPIGGHDQTGNFKIDARFNRKTLLDRLRLIHLYSSQITVTNMDGRQLIEKYDAQDCLIYADPPYFLKAGTLYLNSFSDDDHAALADCLNSRASTSNWILTYDNVPQVHELYSLRVRTEIGVYYSARAVTKAKEILVSSDTIQIPAIEEPAEPAR